jgi:ribosome-associated protein
MTPIGRWGRVAHLLPSVYRAVEPIIRVLFTSRKPYTGVESVIFDNLNAAVLDRSSSNICLRLEKIVTTLQARPKAPARLTRNSPLFKNILRAIAEKKGENVVSLDLRKIDEAVADFFILCQAQSHTQIKAIADAIEDAVREHSGERPFHREEGQQWTLVDYVNIVVHLFTPEYRQFYDLESLWADAVRTEHRD